jgi:MFS family permease
MADHAAAEEHLRVIRTLMERATVYRAISAPTALIGGCVALLLAVSIQWREHHWAQHAPEVMRHISTREFAALWLAALVLVLLINIWFVRREAQRDGRPLISPAMKLALRAILPCLALSAAVTIWFFYDGYEFDNELLLVRTWIGFYGLALVATQHFAPRSLVYLGWAFLLTAVVMTIASRQLEYYATPLVPNVAMGATFGVYHLIYAACVWRAPATPLE